MDPFAILSLLNKLDEILIENLQLEMKRRGWHPARLAREIGVRRDKLSKILKHQQDWDSDFLSACARAFGIPAWTLLRGEREPISMERALEELAEHMGYEIKKK